MLRPGTKIDLKNVTRKGYDCEKATYKKYGKEILVTEFINAGKAGTIAKEIIGKTVDMTELKRMTKDIPNAPETLNFNLDPYTANRIAKCAKIEFDKLQDFKRKQAELEKLKETQPKEGNVNE